MTSVYRLFKLAKFGQKFTKDHKTLERDLHVVTDKWAEQTNGNSEINGQFYELDTEATKLYHAGEDFKATKEVKAKAKAKAKAEAEAEKDTLNEINSNQ